MTADELKAMLVSLNMSQGALAVELGVRPETVWRWTKGRNPIPGPAARAITSMAERVANDQVFGKN